MKNKREPIFRIAKRDNSRWFHLAIAYLAAIAIALLAGALLLRIQGVPFATFYKNMFTIGTIGNKFAYKNFEGFIRLFVPLLITSVGLSLAFRMRFWNIGGEGQFIIGALCAGFIAYRFGNSLPGPVALVLMSLAGMLGGGIFGSVVALLKVKYNTNETLMTLMLNYIALYLLRFVAETKAEWNFFLSFESVRPLFANFPDSAKMPMLNIGLGSFRLNISLIIAVLICFAVFAYLKYTKQGYEISVVGDSANTARYAGMTVGKITLRTIFISAALIGLAGAFYASSAGVLSASITNDVGWTGIIVAWLAKLNTVAIFITSILITILQYGSQVASTSYPTVDANFADLIQGIILFSVLMADFFTRFKIVWRKPGVPAQGQEVSK